jgi:hypothetical protein
MDMETLWAEMDGLFEYGKNPLCKRGFEGRKVLLKKFIHQTRITKLPIGYRATPMGASYEILDR